MNILKARNLEMWTVWSVLVVTVGVAVIGFGGGTRAAVEPGFDLAVNMQLNANGIDVN